VERLPSKSHSFVRIDLNLRAIFSAKAGWRINPKVYAAPFFAIVHDPGHAKPEVSWRQRIEFVIVIVIKNGVFFRQKWEHALASHDCVCDREAKSGAFPATVATLAPDNSSLLLDD
jgi:hypothetical protein